MNEIVSRQLREQLKNLPHGNNVFVLKGVPLSFICEENFPENLSAAADNPLNYFITLTKSGRKFLTYEEFLLIKEFCLAQYDNIYILNNNLFMKQYPIEAKFSDTTKKLLLEYFAEPEDTIDEPKEKNLGNVAKLTKIFVGLKAYKDFLIGGYNDDKVFVRSLDLFAPADEELEEISSSDATGFIDLQEEENFVDFVRKIIFDKPDKIYVRTCNYSGNGEKLDSRLKIICKYFSAQTKIFRVCPEKIAPDFQHREEFNEILKNNLTHSAFKTFKVYDRQKLYGGQKILRDVSQEQIISDIVGQVENRINGKDSRDIFVTAPTGAGKSVMFQVPAIYLAEKYNLLTIVISPLIALMNDQVQNLELKNYKKAKTINSDISQILKEDWS